VSNEPGKQDRLIDEALQDLTAGAPRDGFRRRVMARITASPEPMRVRFIEILGWRVRPAHLAAAGALAMCVLVAALVVPSLLRRGGPSPAQTQTAGNPPVVSPQVTAAASAPGAIVRLQAVNVPSPSRPRRATVPRAAGTAETPAADDASSAVQWVTVDPLPNPDPIVHRAIEIRPVEIEPLVIPEIQVPSLEAIGTVRSPGPSK
jgi:hypothetical protein